MDCVFQLLRVDKFSRMKLKYTMFFFLNDGRDFQNIKTFVFDAIFEQV